MQILAVSDMHGKFENVRQLVEKFQPAILFCTGDWGDPGEVIKQDLLFLTEQTQLISITGNHDDPTLLNSIQNKDGSPILLKQGEIREVLGLRVAGISGIWAKSHRMPYYVTDDDVASQVESLKGPTLDFLLTHGCPIGLSDLTPVGTRGGQRCFLDANTVLKPNIHLCGHLHRKSIRRLRDGHIAVNIGTTAQGDYLLMEGKLPLHPEQWRIQDQFGEK